MINLLWETDLKISENGMRHKNVRSGRTYYKGFFLPAQGYPENLRKDLVVVCRKTR
jgi:hypothetical protein